MADLKSKIQNVLNEIRILVLSAQVLVSFEYLAAFQKRFQDLPQSSRHLKLASLALVLLTVALLMTPVAFDRIVEGGRFTRRLHRFATRMMTPALVPFAIALAIDVFIATRDVAGYGIAVGVGIATVVVALVAWWGGALVSRARHGHPSGEQPDEQESSLKDRIQTVLTEARVVLPGAQALLGFGFSAILNEGFNELPERAKFAHLTSLAFVALCIILLVTPAAYHRIAEEGEDSEHFLRFASRLVATAMVPLAIALSLEFFVAVTKVTQSMRAGVIGGVAIAIVFFSMWFGYTGVRRVLRERQFEG